MGDAPGAEAEWRGIGITRLNLEARPVYGASIEARGRAGLEAAAAQTELLESFAEEDSIRFARASSGILLLSAMDEAVQERAGGDDDGRGTDGTAIAEADAADDAVVGRIRKLASRFIVRAAGRLERRGVSPRSFARKSISLRMTIVAGLRGADAFFNDQIGNFGLLDL